MTDENIIVQMIACTDIIPKKNPKRCAMMKKGIRIGLYGGNRDILVIRIFEDEE